MRVPRNLAKKMDQLAASKGTVSSVEIPVPPSTNRLFIEYFSKRLRRNVKVPTDEYKHWQDRVSNTVRKLRSPMRYPCELVFTIVGKVNESRDGDNFEKAIGDALVKNSVLKDDSLRYVRKWTIEYCPWIGHEGMIRIEIKEADLPPDLLTGFEV